ncbi:MAG: hypothetical protein K5695_04845 [Oscillospiraceae bacterium]|nr:hypothetical protein [Oscillospiraceae bacterium]
MTKRSFPTVLLSLMLVLALLVTGLGTPGFLVPLLSGKQPVGGNEPVSDDDGKPLEVIPLAEGHSKPFRIEPLPGITISAEENALDHDRDFRMTELEQLSIDNAEAELSDLFEQPYLAVGGWHLDAGLADDETLPGTFTMRFDLDELGVLPENYEAVTLFRRDDAGMWYEYAVGIRDHYLEADSYQNCDILAMIAIGLVISIPKITDWAMAYASGAYFNPATGTFKVKVPEVEGGEDEKFRYEIMVSGWEMKRMLEDVQNEMKAGANSVCRPIAEKRVREERGIHADKPMSEWSMESKQLLKKYTQEEVNRYIADSKITKQLDETIGKREKDFRKDFECVNAVEKLCKRAYPYIKNQVGVNTPSDLVRLELSATTDAGVNAVTIAPFIGNPYVVLNMLWVKEGKEEQYNELLLTMVHELFHISQRTYVYKSRANDKFDELLAQMVEDDAAMYFFHQTPYDRKTNSKQWQFYELPLDSKSVTYPEIKVKAEPANVVFKYIGLTFSGPVTWVQHLVDNILYVDTVAASYPLANFVRYLNEEYIPEPLSYDTIMKRYKSLWGSRSLTTILKKVFSMDDAQLTEAYHTFGETYITRFYNSALSGDPAFAPYVPMVKEKKRVTLYNFSYTTRVRRFYGKKRTDKDKEFSLLFVLDDNFADSAADLKMIPVDKTLGVDYYATEKMWYFNPMEIHNWYIQDNDILGKARYLMSKTPDLAILESDGGTGTKGWFTSSKTGYDVYILYAPEEPEWQIDGTELQVMLAPIDKKAERSQFVDSYVITLRIGETQVYREQVMLETIEKDPKEPWKLDLNSIKVNGQKLTDEQKENLTMDIQECVTGTYPDQPWLGPSNPIPLSGGYDIFGKWDVEFTMNSLDHNYMQGILEAMPPGMREAYEQALESSSGQTTKAVMTVTKLEDESIEAVIDYEDSEAPDAYYAVKFEPGKKLMTLTPKQQMLTDPLELYITGSGSDLTFTCKMKYQSGIVDYDADMTGTKRKEEAIVP